MKVLNKGEQFQLTYNASDVFVPAGLSGEFSAEVAYHIQFVAKNWGKDVVLISNIDEERVALSNFAKEEKAEVKVEEPKAETVKLEETKTK